MNHGIQGFFIKRNDMSFTEEGYFDPSNSVGKPMTDNKIEMRKKAELITKIEEAKEFVKENDTWGEISLLIPDETFNKTECLFAENHNISELVHNFKQVIFDMGTRYGCLNHVFAHQAVNRLKEAEYWANQFINNRESEV